MLFLGLVLAAATALLCYAGYVFLIVDKREAAKEMEEPELFEELDMKEYFFELPEAVDTFEGLRATTRRTSGRCRWRCSAARRPTSR